MDKLEIETRKSRPYQCVLSAPSAAAAPFLSLSETANSTVYGKMKAIIAQPIEFTKRIRTLAEKSGEIKRFAAARQLSHLGDQAPVPGLSLKCLSNLSGTVSHSLASAGAVPLWVMFGHFFA